MSAITLAGPANMHRHAQKVLNGEYDIPYEYTAPVILDIGANIGSFAVWALHRWPGCFVHCYEPVSDNFEFLQANLAVFPGRVKLNEVAIGNPDRTRMFLGLNNCGEASFFDLGEQSSETVEVETWPPSRLPKAQILKLDVEGAEVEILAGLQEIDFAAIMIEYHSEEIRRRIDRMLDGYVLVGSEARAPHRGVVKYLKAQ